MIVQDQIRIFATYLVENASWHMLTKEEARENKPLPDPWEELLTGGKTVYSQADNDKHLEALTLFSEYKKIRDRHIPDGPKYHQFFSERFRRDMTKEEIWNRALGVINEWLGQKGIERK